MSAGAPLDDGRGRLRHRARVIWHDLECGGYAEDLELWRALAARRDPVLEVGAGTGRVALALARAGHRVTALDHDADFLAELERRAAGLPVSCVLADAREFDLGTRFSLCLVPMQTIQLLGGPPGRRAFLRCARRHLDPDGIVAVAIAPSLECFEVSDGEPAPLPDIREHDGVVYASQPTAVRRDRDGFVLERRREMVAPDGRHFCGRSSIRLDHLDCDQLEREGLDVGLARAGRAAVPATEDYAGSEVVMLGA